MFRNYKNRKNYNIIIKKLYFFKIKNKFIGLKLNKIIKFVFFMINDIVRSN